MKTIAVVPTFGESRFVCNVVRELISRVDHIVVIDDKCPENSGSLVEATFKDQNVEVIYNSRNLGVGGSVIAGYVRAIELNADVIVKVDGDGQMDPAEIPRLVLPIKLGEADYTKGNRFSNLDELQKMPKLRLFGNSVLSLITKFSSGYWAITDPTNGYTAVHSAALKQLDMRKLSQRYFFESDLLFRLNLAGAVVEDVPMPVKYGQENSSLSIKRAVFEFAYKNFRNYVKRILYRYYLRELTVSSIEFPLSIASLASGLIILSGVDSTELASPNSIWAAFLVILGVQLGTSFLHTDMTWSPRTPIQRRRI